MNRGRGSESSFDNSDVHSVSVDEFVSQQSESPQNPKSQIPAKMQPKSKQANVHSKLLLGIKPTKVKCPLCGVENLTEI